MKYLLYKTGSQNLSFLDTTHDIDYAVLTDDASYIECFKKFNIHTKEADYHVMPISVNRDFPDISGWPVTHFMKLIENKGDLPEELPDITTLENSVKYLKDIIRLYPYINKKMYYWTSIGLCEIYNSNYEFTEEQKYHINSIHNTYRKGISKEDLTWYQTLLDNCKEKYLKDLV